MVFIQNVGIIYTCVVAMATLPFPPHTTVRAALQGTVPITSVSKVTQYASCFKIGQLWISKCPNLDSWVVTSKERNKFMLPITH